MKEQIKAPENNTTKRRRDSQPTRCTVQKILTEMVEYGCKIEERVEAMKSELKENAQGTNSDEKETGTQIMVWIKRKKETFNQNRMKKQEFKTMRRGLETSGTTLSVSTSESLGCQKEKNKSKKLKTYLKT